MNEPGICPVCNAFQDPDTGNCLICGKHYHLLDIPKDKIDNSLVGDFFVRLPNGFLTFRAMVEMVVEHEQRTTLRYNKKEIPSIFRDEAKLIFRFINDDDALYKIYTCGTLVD